MNADPCHRIWRWWWIPVGAVLLAAAYLPSLANPFDFIDDGNLVYPARAGTSLSGHVELWWQHVVKNYDALGPFRPTLWMHWDFLANTLGPNPVAWRAWRLAWCALAAGMLLWLMRELHIHPIAALIAGAAAMWNPYRNEIWTSLTLGEGVAMPYALFALIAARRGATAKRPLPWDLASAAAVVVALGCKNTFVALIPAQMMLRVWPDGVGFRSACAANGKRALALSLTALLPVAHYIYFKMHWHPGQYETHPPSWSQFARILSNLKGAMNADYLGAGFGLLALALWAGVRASGVTVRAAASRASETHRAGLLCACLLPAAGIFVYLPMSAMSGRYSMPAVWGLDILFALALTALIQLPGSRSRILVWVAIGGGLLGVLIACEVKQDKIIARSRLLWDAVHHVEQLPPCTPIEWICGDPQRGELGVEEGIHFAWHLGNTGRPDVPIALIAADGTLIKRSELWESGMEARYRLSATAPATGFEVVQVFEAHSSLGRKQFRCVLTRKAGP